jgi:anti-sigma regulatory factor (Ser/Thr protein kinase)
MQITDTPLRISANAPEPPTRHSSGEHEFDTSSDRSFAMGFHAIALRAAAASRKAFRVTGESPEAAAPPDTAEASFADRPEVLLSGHAPPLKAENAASCTLPPNPAAVADARAWTTRQLAAWAFDDLAFTTALIVSELVTNALRYAAGPVGLRLIHDDSRLICEVSDTSSSGPCPRTSNACDEGGRGLAIVAQLTLRQGTRFTDTGKTVWTEQSLEP